MNRRSGWESDSTVVKHVNFCNSRGTYERLPHCGGMVNF
jgi:hypothetical protein